MAANLCSSSRKWKNDTKGNSEMIRAIIPTTETVGKAVSSSISESRATAESQVCWALQESRRDKVAPQSNGGDTATLLGLKGKALSLRKLFSGLKV